MLTVAEALELPILNKAQVVAGQHGVTRPIRWVHTVGVPDGADWLNGGELVLTTIFNMPDTRQEQCKFIRQLASKDIVGVIITIGKLIDEIPDYLRQIGNELDLPLIEIPYEERFVDIAKTINERISEENLDNVSRALLIQQRLSQLVLEGGGFWELAEMLANLMGHSISIENERFEAIANKNIAEVDSARRYTILHGRTNPLLIEALEDIYLPKIRETLRPVYLPVIPEVGLEMERLLAPIVVHSEIYGYMWIIADVHALSQIDMLAVEIGATVAALLMLYQESVQTAEASLKGSLMAQLIEGDASRETILSDQSLRYGIDLRSPYIMMVIEADNSQPRYVTQLYRIINRVLTQQEIQAVAGQFAGQVVILIQANQEIQSLSETLIQRLKNNNGKARIGISMTFKDASNVGNAHQQCIEVLEITQRLKAGASIQHFADLGYMHTLFHAGIESLNHNPHAPVLRELLDEKQADLFNTLEAYLDEGGNSVQTADILHIHRSTLNYRLARIKEICGVELSSSMTRMNLQIALKLMRLFEDIN
jgi:PucR family transcriptional regulator, purine catabolism regulatory protein